MNQNFSIEGAQFFTATIYGWNHLLADDNHKNIIVDSLRFLVTDNRIELNAFVIMSNHITFDLATFTRIYIFRHPGFFYEIYSPTVEAFTN